MNMSCIEVEVQGLQCLAEEIFYLGAHGKIPSIKANTLLIAITGFCRSFKKGEPTASLLEEDIRSVTKGVIDLAACDEITAVEAKAMLSNLIDIDKEEVETRLEELFEQWCEELNEITGRKPYVQGGICAVAN